MRAIFNRRASSEGEMHEAVRHDRQAGSLGFLRQRDQPIRQNERAKLGLNRDTAIGMGDEAGHGIFPSRDAARLAASPCSPESGYQTVNNLRLF
jgi:hypothetical protein